MNDLYGIQVPRAIGEGFSFDSSVLADALRAIYVSSDLDPLTELDPGLFQETARIITQATDKGISQSAYDPDHAFRNALQHSNEVFAAFKVHRLQRDMAAQLLDSNGNLKSFKQWSEDVAPIASHQVGSWLQTEYDTAIIRAHQAADWQQFQAEKDILPNLKWMPSTSAHPGADHQVFWNTVRPVDDSFWNDHRPGDRWNCKCSLSSTTDPVTDLPDGQEGGVTTPSPSTDPHQGLKTKAGSPQVFSQDHPYFPDDCSSCPFHASSSRSNGLSRWLPFTAQKKHCYNCQFIDGCIPGMNRADKNAAARLKKVKKQIDQYDGKEISGAEFSTGKLIVLRRSLQDVYEHGREDANLMKWLTTFDMRKIKGWKYEGWAENRPYDSSSPKFDPKNPDRKKHPEAEYFTYYSLKIGNDIYWANVKVHKLLGSEVLYTIEKKKPNDIITGYHK